MFKYFLATFFIPPPPQSLRSLLRLCLCLRPVSVPVPVSTRISIPCSAYVSNSPSPPSAAPSPSGCVPIPLVPPPPPPSTSSLQGHFRPAAGHFCSFRHMACHPLTTRPMTASNLRRCMIPPGQLEEDKHISPRHILSSSRTRRGDRTWRHFYRTQNHIIHRRRALV